MTLLLPPVPGTGPLAVAYSGGLDSTVLLHLLAHEPTARARGLRALHVDHGLHPDSEAWVAHCASVCAQWQVPFESRRITVAPTGDGLEAAARVARHRALAEWQREEETFALAHHQDDQAETMLLRLMRGAGEGLAAMRPCRRFHRGWLWRPLLASPRTAIQAYAQDHALRWIEDPSNASERHDRNFLRHRVLPALSERWPHAAASVARSAGLIAVQADLLAEEDARRLARLQGLDPATLPAGALAAQPPSWRDRLLRAWVASLGLPPLPAGALSTLCTDLLEAAPDTRAEFAWSGAVIRRWRELLYAGRRRPPLPADWTDTWTGEAPLTMPSGSVLAMEPACRFDSPVRLSARRGGERLVLPGRDHSSELKHVLQDLGIPPWERARLPLLWSADGELLAAGDVTLSGRLQHWLEAKATRLVLAADENNLATD